MLKKTISIVLALVTVLSLLSALSFTANADELNAQTLATADEAEKDEATFDEVKLMLSDEPKVDASSVNGTVIGYMGDSNLDGKINIKDCTAIQKYLAKYTLLNEQAKLLSDVDNNKKLNVRDATAVQKYVAGMKVESSVWYLLYQTGTHTHSFVEEVVEVKCETDGYTLKSCICGEEMIENVVKAQGHDYKSKIVSANCVEDGYTEYICTVCKYSYKDNITKATGVHNFDDEICKVCGYTEHKLFIDLTTDYVIKNGEYDKENDVYVLEIEPFFDYEYAILTTQKGVNAVALTYCVYFEDGYDIISVGFTDEKEEVEYYMFCSGYFECAGTCKIGEFTTDVDDAEFYFYVDGISKEDALEYTLDYVYDSTEVLFMGETLPESIRNLMLQ